MTIIDFVTSYNQWLRSVLYFLIIAYIEALLMYCIVVGIDILTVNSHSIVNKLFFAFKVGYYVKLFCLATVKTVFK